MECGEKCFTFTWKLENVSFCLQRKDEVIKSPAFVVDTIKEKKWTIGLYPRGKENGSYIGLYLFEETDSKVSGPIEIIYGLSCILKDGSAVTYRNDPIKYDFSEYEGFGFPTFQKREDVFLKKRLTFLPQDTLTVRCKIWKSNGEMTENVQCFARTRISVEKRSFLWNLKDFSSLESEKKYNYQIKSIEDDLLMSIDLSLSGGLISEDIINFELSLQDETIKFSSLRLFLIDASGKKLQCNHEEIWFDDPSKSKEFKFCYSKNKLMAMKSSYLPDDILSLHWEWAFSKGFLSEEIEDIQWACTTSESNSFSPKVNNENSMSLSYTLNDRLKSLRDENFLCDAKLKTKTSCFNVHKIILSAASPVFKAMFSSDMKEKESNIVNIEDLSDDTINRMLGYIYTAHMEDLTWERASHLYVAADKYEILSLKNICSSYLKDNLSPINACEALLLSDFHLDSDLKSVAQDYILKNVKDIIKSEGWKLLMETNAKLAAETLCLQHE